MADKRNRRKSRANQPEMNQKALWAAVVFAVIGAALALYAANMTFKIATQGLVEASGCSLNDLVNCDVASASTYATMLGIPVAWWGFLFYAFSAFSALFAATASDRTGAAPFVSMALVLSFGAVLFTFLKAYHLVELGVICLVCVGMYIANFGTAISLGFGLGYGPQRWGAFLGDWISAIKGNTERLGFDPALVKSGIAVLVVFGIGFAGALNHKRDITGTNNFDMKTALDAHFRQPPVDIAVPDDAAQWGNTEADIQIVEFADFQCPACRVSAFHLRPALFQFKDDVSLRFMNYPLNIHVHAETAARAGVCAERFGDFWGYHDLVFRDQAQMNQRLFTDKAQEMGWDAREFAECVVSPEVGERVASDRAAGVATGLNATPTLFINGRKVAYWSNTDFIQAVLQRELG